MEYLTNEDLSFLSQQSQNKMNMIVFGMTALMDETNDRVHQLESQTWFQRMSNTLTGKNKMTVNEIANNRDKINVYLSEAISCLYDQNKINENIILGLGNRLNELYAQQIEIKQMIGAFVTKLNQKIISIDNFHMLTEEINQGVYSAQTPIVSICRIVSQLDARTIHDSRKMEILLRAMEQNGLLSDEEVLFSAFLQELLTVSESDSGVIAMMFENAKEDYMTEIALQTVCQYYLLPDKVRKMKSKKAVVESVLRSNEIDLDCEISTKEYCESLIDCLINNIVIAEDQEKMEEIQRKYNSTLLYFDSILSIFDFSKKLFNSWRFEKNECLLPNYKNNTGFWLKKIDMFCSRNSTEGIQYDQSLSSIDCFVQSIIKINEYWDAFPKDGLYEVNGEYYTMRDLIQMSLNNQIEMNFSKSKISLSNIDSFGGNIFFDSFGGMTMLFDGLASRFSFVKETFAKQKDNILIIEEVYNLCNRYPIEFNQENFKDLIKPMVRVPYISFTKKDSLYDNFEFESKNHVDVSFSHITQAIIRIHFNNMDKLGSIHYSILENYHAGDHNQRGYNVKWGKWQSDNVCELIIDQIYSEHDWLDSLKIKVWADYDPNCEGIIEGH